jgi:hypothetical protein
LETEEYLHCVLDVAVRFRLNANQRACNPLPPTTWTCRTSSLNPTDEDIPNEISRIEAQLEELAESSERCRKIILVSKVAIAGGITLLLFMSLGLFGSNEVAAIGSIAVVLGGIVSLGSNASTLQQTMAAMSAAEALRSDLISRIDLRVVSDRRRWNGFDVATINNVTSDGGIQPKPMSAFSALFEVEIGRLAPSDIQRRLRMNHLAQQFAVHQGTSSFDKSQVTARKQTPAVGRKHCASWR